MLRDTTIRTQEALEHNSFGCINATQNNTSTQRSVLHWRVLLLHITESLSFCESERRVFRMYWNDKVYRQATFISNVPRINCLMVGAFRWNWMKMVEHWRMFELFVLTGHVQVANSLHNFSCLPLSRAHSIRCYGCLYLLWLKWKCDNN